MPQEDRRKGKRKGKEFYQKAKDQAEKDSSFKRFGANDINWYKMSDQLLKDVASLPFGRPLGLEQPIGTINETAGANQLPTVTLATNMPIVPGICIFDYANACGGSYGAASPENVAARAIYSFVRHANSGHTNYESPDLMCYLIAVGELYTGISYLEKVYGLSQYWSQRNRYFGDRLITALGFSANDVRVNLAQLRAGINLLITKVNALAAPKVFSIYERRFFLAGNVLKDQDIAKCQIYSFRPKYLGAFSGTHASTGSCVVPIECPWKMGTCTVYSALNFLNTFVDELLAEEDIGIMNGDIMKAFGNGEKGGLHILLPIPDGYICEPVYSEELMLQIHNLKFTAFTPYYFNSVASLKAATQITPTASNVLTNYAGGIYQVAGSLYETIGMQQGINYSLRAHNTTDHTETSLTIQDKVALGMFLDMFSDNPTPEDVMIATRLQPHIDTSGGFIFKSINWYKAIVGADYVISADVWDGENSFHVARNNVKANFDLRDSTYSSDVYIIRPTSYADIKENNIAQDALLKFHRAPFCFEYLVAGDQTASSKGRLVNVGELTYFTDVEVNYSEPSATATLGNLHLSALLSCFKVPDLGMYKV